ncbi:MAG TPA: GIY-YIG nuclease family protein [Nevskiaceae bacterium]|nr:GIY-YIG nuclease family protein [Nevskiaceae bacterium]
MDVAELLKLRGLDVGKKIKFVRHQDQRYNLYDLMTSGQLETYQACQSKPVLECDYMVSFVGLPHGHARLYGVYQVLGRCRVSDVQLSAEYPNEENPNNYFYTLSKVPGFEDLEERVVINWGASTRSWHQWLRHKEVTEVLPAGYARPFPGYLDFVLGYHELDRIVRHPEANREWKTALSNVAGVYLILQQRTGAQYVGSASGAAGIFGRWETYAGNGHGGNKLLREVCAEDPDAFRGFKFSVLRTLPKSMTQREVVAYENIYKEKLGSRVFGLNGN